MKENLEPLLRTGGLDKLLDILIQFRRRRASGEPVQTLTEDEVIGEHPDVNLGSLKLDKEEMNEQGGRLDNLRDWAIENKSRIFQVATIGGTTVVIIGSFWMLKHILASDEHADITERDNS